MGVVALRKESVDRNQVAVHFVGPSAVALRKESVDRNLVAPLLATGGSVALRKESVDRNSIASASMRAYTSRSPQGERG